MTSEESAEQALAFAYERRENWGSVAMSHGSIHGVGKREMENFEMGEAARLAALLDQVKDKAREAGRQEERERADRLEAAIRWAAGESGTFPTRQPGQGPYYWRSELYRRAALDALPGGAE